MLIGADLQIILLEYFHVLMPLVIFCSELESGKEEEDVRTESDGDSSDTVQIGKELEVVDIDLLKNGARQALEFPIRLDGNLSKQAES
jgi:hypothetical protein